MSIKRFFTLLFIVASVSGCSVMAPPYQAGLLAGNDIRGAENVDMKTGHFTMEKPSLNKIGLRASNLVSPYKNSFSEYLRKGLEEELKIASLWNENSDVVVSAVLLENDVDASGINIGTADLSANFEVNAQGEKIYDRTHSIHHEWDSSFMGAIAITNSQLGYQEAVKKLLRNFLNDPALLSALTIEAESQ
ncbi:hypothetical protein L4D15_02525 [Enterovibrio norvegicus]|uniref:hypothetical protein n=1 Tax=Enterovibrio norvegicus TaxID=188144 RepID=UPI003061723F